MTATARSITFTCPLCEQPSTVDAAVGGRKARCPSCQGKIVIPEIDGVYARPVQLRTRPAEKPAGSPSGKPGRRRGRALSSRRNTDPDAGGIDIALCLLMPLIGLILATMNGGTRRGKRMQEVALGAMAFWTVLSVIARAASGRL